jgi:hypothetical protein
VRFPVRRDPAGRAGINVPDSAGIGQHATITVTPPQSGTVPVRYEYQLNADHPGFAVADASGSATITVTPSRFTNLITVTGLSPAGNLGAEALSDPFYATPGAPAADADLTGDGTADLVTVGGGGMPPGLWLAAGAGDGKIAAQAADFGANGNGTARDYSPADFNGAQVITGHFAGTQFQDALVYYPAGTDAAGQNAGQANVLLGTGDGSPNSGIAGGDGGDGSDGSDSGTSGGNVTVQPLTAGTFADFSNDNPVQLASAGDTQGAGYSWPDLIGINGDSLDGYYLEFYPNTDGFGQYGQAIPLATLTPSGGSDWSGWQIATAQVASGTGMYLWDSGTGALYLWEGLHYDAGTQALSYTQYAIADGSSAHWNAGAGLTLHAADLNGDGTPDLQAVNPGGVVTAYLASPGTGTAALSAQPAQTLLASAHTWPLTDGRQNAGITTAADTAGAPALPLAGSGGWSWNTGDVFDPDVMLDGSSGALAASGAAVNPNSGGFTVSAWASPAVLGGTVVSQDMSSTASFRLSSTAGGAWSFCLAASDVASPSQDCATGGDAQPGEWSQLTATYDPATTVVNLYQGDVNVASATHTALSGVSNGAFQVGDYRSGSSRTGYFSGQVSGVQTWNRVITPAQVAAPDGYFHPVTATRLLDTRAGDGWHGHREHDDRAGRA